MTERWEESERKWAGDVIKSLEKVIQTHKTQILQARVRWWDKKQEGRWMKICGVENHRKAWERTGR